MKRSICTYSAIPVRASNSEATEMVTQILFGETYEVQEVEGRWAKIRMQTDGYEGWIDSKLVTDIAEEEIDRWNRAEMYILPEAVTFVQKKYGDDGMPLNRPIFLTQGSEIHGLRKTEIPYEGSFLQIFNLNGDFWGIEEKPSDDANELDPVASAMHLMGAPYLWGGRTVMGIDCSGLVQIAFKVCGKQLPRDASQMINLGEEIDIANAQRNDVAFFKNGKGRICHIGICRGEGTIVHSSGMVRIDTLDNQGIFNHERGIYTHQLACIKRMNWE